MGKIAGFAASYAAQGVFLPGWATPGMGRMTAISLGYRKSAKDGFLNKILFFLIFMESSYPIL